MPRKFPEELKHQLIDFIRTKRHFTDLNHPDYHNAPLCGLSYEQFIQLHGLNGFFTHRYFNILGSSVQLFIFVSVADLKAQVRTLRGQYISCKSRYNAREKTKSGQAAFDPATQTKSMKTWKFFDKLAEIYDQHEEGIIPPVDNFDLVSQQFHSIPATPSQIDFPAMSHAQQSDTSSGGYPVFNRYMDPMDQQLVNRHEVNSIGENCYDQDNFEDYVDLRDRDLMEQNDVQTQNTQNNASSISIRPIFASNPMAPLPPQKSISRKRRLGEEDDALLLSDARDVLRGQTTSGKDYENFGKSLGSMLAKVPENRRLQVFQSCCNVCFEALL